MERAAQKLRLDQLVIQQGRTQQSSKCRSSCVVSFVSELTPSRLATNKDDLVDMIQHGAEKIINSTESMLVQDDIEDIITRGEARTAELSTKYASLNFDDLQIFKSETTTNWEGEDYGGKKKPGMLFIEPTKRERKMYAASYAVDGASSSRSNVPKAPRAPKQVAASVSRRSHSPRILADDPLEFRHDFQFFPKRLNVIQDKETRYHRVRSLLRISDRLRRRLTSRRCRNRSITSFR